ncbi:hypothetical protein JYU34_008082 [Plutella xylostella]|uniref:Uncharacterized protein n=1 Tax=Plutella xylostella TaxID=51655 RepID=A0ABQ7QNP1_PLUXY|nr:hypothetical protein JYU34_008082 [Plutella xylostella]
MMFSTEKCSGHSRSGSPDEAEIFAGGGEGLGKDGVASDEVASAVAAVSDDIGDILKDELGDADRADRIGAELADLSAELGILAGLDDGQPQADFPSLFEIAIGHRGSGSVSSSSSSTSSSGVHRARRPPRPLRTGRRKPITKQAKEASRRRSALGRRVVSLRLPRLELVSDASDVPASCDSDDQWTELDDAVSSEDSSVKNASTAAEVDSSEYQDKPQDAEAPPMGQFLLPLLSADTGAAPAQFLIRHEDILQLLASAEAQAEMPGGDEDNYGAQDDIMQNELFPCDQPSPVSPEDEAALLNYVCDAPEDSCEWQAVDEWLMGVHHSRSEVSVFIYTMSVCAAILGIEMEQWVYRCRFPCHCALCLCACASRAAVRSLYERVRRALHEGDDTTVDSAWLTRSLGTELDVASWDPARRPPVSDAGATVIHEQLLAEAQKSELANKIICRICECRPYDKPLEKQYAVERFFKILENYKAVSTGTFKVEMLKTDGERDFRLEKLLSRYLTAYQQGTTSERLRQTRLRTTPQEVNAWAGYKHKCECLTPRTLCAQQRKELLRLSFLQVVNELHRKTEPSEGDKATNDAQAESPCRELQQGDGTGAKPPDACLNALTEREDSGREMSDSNITQDLDDDDDDDDDDEDDDDDDDDDGDGGTDQGALGHARYATIICFTKRREAHHQCTQRENRRTSEGFVQLQVADGKGSEVKIQQILIICSSGTEE